MSDPEFIYIMSDNIIEVTSVQNVATGEYLNDADVTLTLVDAASGNEIAGQTWPLALSYVSSSNGNYRGTINDDVSISHQQSLRAKVTVDAGAGLRRYWEKPCTALVGS